MTQLLQFPSSLAISPICAAVDLDAIRHNVRVLREYAGGAAIMAAVKADAYGHGVVPVARALQEAEVKHFAVASVNEGIELRVANVEQAIYVLGAPIPETLPAYVRHRLVVTISSAEVANAVIAAASQTGPFVVHIKVDTGMHRLGMPPAEVPEVLGRLRATSGISVEGIWTHFATVDRSFTLQQLGRFDELLTLLDDPPPVTHVANSGTLLFLPETSQRRTLVRIGGALYGLVVEHRAGAEEAGLQPAMQLVSRVVHVQTVEPGETVSYGRTWKAERATRIATVSAGYGDGLPRSLSNKGVVGIHSQLYPVVGRVCMDMLMVDVGDPDAEPAVRLGDEVVLFGKDGPSAVELAESIDTIAYELTCGLTQRVPRVHRGEETARPET